MKKTSPDLRSAQVVQQAIKDDQALAAVAKDIRVTVKDGAITLDGQVSTEQQMNLATNTAAAVGVVDQVDNRMEVTHDKPTKDLARADDDGFALPARIKGRMMKRIFSIMAAGALFFSQAGSAGAASKTFTVSATIPTATSVGINAFSVTGSTATAVSGLTLNFNPMVFNAATHVFLPNHFFYVEVGPAGGAGNTDVNVTYTEGANPNSPAHGLGWKSVATFMKAVGATETQLSAHGPKKMLKDLSGEHITTAELSGGILRMYLGIVAKDPTAPVPDPAASELFTDADHSGAYTGSVVITATVS